MRWNRMSSKLLNKKRISRVSIQSVDICEKLPARIPAAIATVKENMKNATWAGELAKHQSKSTNSFPNLLPDFLKLDASIYMVIIIAATGKNDIKNCIMFTSFAKGFSNLYKIIALKKYKCNKRRFI